AFLAPRVVDAGASPGSAESLDNLSAPWQQQDIGTMSVPGNGVENLGVVTISSAGDIGGTGDGFHFVFQPMSGDGEIVARVSALAAIDPWSQAGVMMRGALTSSAPEVFIGATGGNGWVVQRRDDTTSGTTETTQGPSGRAP